MDALIYWLSRFLCRCFVTVWHRVGVRGAAMVPREGAVLLVSNHASHLDPILLGSGLRRRCWFVARSTLGDIPVVGAWMRSIGVMFVDRAAPTRASIDRVVEALEQGHAVGMFPEGSRSRDGRLKPFQRGMLLLLKKSDATVVPVGIRGSFAAFPPGTSIPRPRKVTVHFGAPRPAAQVLAPGGLEALRREIAGLAGSELADGGTLFADSGGSPDPG
ncbi:MAG: 1-acyl-sn-glycerol-3-phosphate acyltransferase [Planctomycetes bacterium]|nr:1-acyl-sn-glycerol-3-phosphate acyltransferase [Planctomycetota bacterium]MCB9868687.1 1-acyl-sn-glycerol-3-phosphate acyltransferase [Planctomycetota bacterium]